MTEIARSVGLTQATVHRTLQALIAQQVVEQDQHSKHYRLRIEFFVLAARAGNPVNLRDLCRPTLLRLCASLGDTLFLLARSGFDAVCLDRTGVRHADENEPEVRVTTLASRTKAVNGRSSRSWPSVWGTQFVPTSDRGPDSWLLRQLCG